MSLLYVLGCFINFYSHYSKRASVRGTHPRYVASTIECLSAALIAFMTLVMLVDSLRKGDPLNSSILFAVFCYWVVETARAFDDDNWFNNQWKRLKRGFKNLRIRLALKPMRPLPLPH